MKGWEIFWLATIIFSVLSFAYMSVLALIKGVAEMKEMFRKFDKEIEK